jgi:DUF4097 and DUF4098 domain-containing protein YvlB
VKVLLFIVLPSLFGIGCSDDEGSNPLAPQVGSHVEEYERTLDGSEVARLDARTMNGTIDLTGGEGEDVGVRIRKVVRAASTTEAREFAEQITVVVERDGDEVAISTTHPEPPHDVEVEVSYTIRCPADIDVKTLTANGAIRLTGTRSLVSATTANGLISVGGHGGPFRLQTTNGRITADIGALTAPSRFTAVNGGVRVVIRDGAAPLHVSLANGPAALTLPRGFCGRLDATTVVGRIDCSLPRGTIHGRGSNHVWGMIGDGCETPVTVRTAIGNIDLESF